MNSIHKISIVLLVLGVLSGCAAKQIEIDHAVYKESPVTSIDYKIAIEPVSITPSVSGTSGGVAAGGLLGALVGGAIDAGVNSSRKKALAPILANIKSFDHNAYVIESIESKSKGVAFSEDLVVVKKAKFSTKDKTLLKPKLTLSSIISPNLGVINISLSNQVYQSAEETRPYLKVYSSSKLVNSDDLEVSKEANQAYWIENSEELIQNLKDGFDEVVEQFVNDLNGENSVVSPETEAAVPES